MNSNHPSRAGNAPPRRGAALLLALAVLVIAVTATAILARAAGTAQMHTRVDRSDSLATNGLASIHQIILDWLKREASNVVLPPDTAEPMVSVLHDVIGDGPDAIEIRITAWDQCGMAPLDMLRSGLPVRGALPPSVLDRLDRSDGAEESEAGLDLFVDFDGRRPAWVAIFPTPQETPPMIFTADSAGTTPDAIAGADSPLQALPVVRDVSGLGGVVATHNPAPSAINVNTTPRGILEATMRDLGRGGIEQIMSSREKNVQAKVAGEPRRREDRSAAAHLVDQSSSWAFRIDVRVGSFRRSWWAIYSNRERERSSQTAWRCVQRIAITE